MTRMKRDLKTTWSTKTLILLAETFRQINAHKHGEMPEDIAALTPEAMKKAPDALNWAAGRIENLERRLRKRP